MSPTGDRCDDLIFGIFFGLGCLGFGHFWGDTVLALGGLFIFMLCLSGLVIGPARRNARASHDLSALGRDQERLAFEDYYAQRRRAS